MKFLTHWVSVQTSHPDFPKNFVSPKMAAILNFQIFSQKLQNFFNHRVSLWSGHPNFQKKLVSQKLVSKKLQKHKNAYISKTILDRVISTKLLVHRVSLRDSHPNFQKKFCLAKNGGHFCIFKFFAKIAEHKNACISKIMQDRAISTKLLAIRVFKATLIFKKKLLSCHKWWPFLTFEFFTKLAKHKHACIWKTVEIELSTKCLTHGVE